MTRSYRTLSSPALFIFEERRSRFTASVFPATSKDSLSEQIVYARRQHPDARHVCSAYLLGDPQQAAAAGFHDDGEPRGTAGRPMLNVLMQREIGDAAAVVVRYFGGIKLGAGGLTRAYGRAVSGALDLAQLTEVLPTTTDSVTVDFAHEGRVRHLLQQFGVDIAACKYAEQVTLAYACPVAQLNDLRARLLHITAGGARPAPAES